MCAVLSGLLVVIALGCGKGDKQDPGPGAKSVAQAGAENAGQAAGTGPAKGSDSAAGAQAPDEPLPVPELEESEMVQEVLETLSAWTDAQSAGDTVAYFGFYDQRSFRGVRRTASGTRKSFDFAGWSEDRAPMVARKPLVIAAYPQVFTWLGDDVGDTLELGSVEVRFIQRFRLGKYADHGPKVLRWRWHGEGAGWKIDREEMVSSKPGLAAKNEAPPVTKVDLREMIPPLKATVRLIAPPAPENEPENHEDADEEPKPMILLTFMDAKGVERTVHLWTDSAGCGVEEQAGVFSVACFWAGAGVRHEMKRHEDVLEITLVLDDEELEKAISHPYAEIALPNKSRLAFREEHVSASDQR